MENVESNLNNLQINSRSEENDEKWGWPLRELYRQGLSFYKEKSGKAVQFSYEDNLKLVAFTQQAAHGPVSDTAAPIGAFDVIGRDRRIAWQNLGNISKVQAMEGFIDSLDRLCPTFRHYAEAIKKNKEEKAQQSIEEERQRKEQLELDRQRANEQQLLEDQRNREEIQKRKLQDALNQQTYLQFRTYAEKQYPGNPEQQAMLIRQLQNEHYHQYMQQLHAQMATENNERDSKKQNIDETDNTCNSVNTTINSDGSQSYPTKDLQYDEKDTGDSDDNDSDGFPPINAANMWTKPDIQQFKAEVANGKGEGVLKIGHGDIVTVRVPTHEGGSCLYWEFATDSYDIGFGVFFEWGKSPTNEVSVQICDSEEDDELGDGDDDDDDIQKANDLESGVSGTTEPGSPTIRLKPPISNVVPVYRRECQNEVYVGSHIYPGEGTYLLKFDNSYSLWRSKTLYYRVFYTR